MRILYASSIVHEMRLLKKILFKHKWQSILVLTAVAMGLAVFWYGDGRTFTAYSVELWDALFSGRLHEYRIVTVENLRNAPHGGANSSVLTILPLAIWNFPIWLTHTFNGNFTIITPLCVMWSKLFLVLCWLIVGMLCYHIVVHLTQNRERASMTPFFIWGSGTIFISIGYAMQDEIVYMLFFLLAIYCFLTSRLKWSALWMVVSVTLYPIMLIPALFLIIAKTKNVIRIFFNCILCLLPTFLSFLFFVEPSHQQDTTTVVDYFYWYFRRTVINIPLGSVSVLALILIVLYCFFYFRSFISNADRDRMLLYLLAFATVGMTLLSWTHFYRLCWYLPFLLICIYSCESDNESSNKSKLALLLLTVFECLLVAYPFFGYPEYLSTKSTMPYLQSFFARRGVPDNLFEAVAAWVPQIGDISWLVASAACAIGICLLYIVSPLNKSKYDLRLSENLLLKLYTACPVLLMLVFCFIPMMASVLSIPINGNSDLAPAIDGNRALAEYYYCENSRIRSIQIQPVTWGRDYPDTLKLCIDIIDAQTDVTIGTVEVFADELPNNSPYQVEFPRMTFEKQNWYIFKIYASEKITNEEDQLFLLRSTDGTVDPTSHYGSIIYDNNDEEYQERVDWDIVSKTVGVR